MNTNELHSLVWKRYIRMPYGHLLDCADTEGNAVIPTADECRAFVPSILGWTTPIADCAMFGGLYLYALCEKYELCPSEHLRNELLTLINGLLLLCDISEVDGFIARGVADDGVTHYPCSSNDQTGPWILGLWKATHSSAIDESTNKEIKQRLCRTLGGFYRNDWMFRNELENTHLGSFKSKDWRNCAKFLFAAAVSRELGVITEDEFSAYATEKPEKSIFTRREVLSHGFSHDMANDPVLAQFWINVCAHLSVCELASLDPEGKAQYECGIALNTVTALAFVRKFDQYKPKDFPPYDHDWRKIVPELKQYSTYEEILEEGKRANPLYSKVCPVRTHERLTLGQALFSAWVAVSGNNREAAEYANACLCECIEKVDWNSVGQSYAFAAEAALISYDAHWKR